MALADTNSTLVVSLSQRLANISVKSQFVTIFSFVSRRVSVAALQLCGCDLKDPLCMNGCDCANKFQLQKQAVGLKSEGPLS